MKSPKNINGVVEVTEKSQGTIAPIFYVQYPGKRKSRIDNEMISERMEVEIESETIGDEVKGIIEKSRDIESINYVSEGNRKIYEVNQSKIVPFCRK